MSELKSKTMKHIDALIQKMAERYDIEIIEDSSVHEVVRENGEIITSNETSFWAVFGLQNQISTAQYKEVTEITKQFSTFGNVENCGLPVTYKNNSSLNNIENSNSNYAIAA